MHVNDFNANFFYGYEFCSEKHKLIFKKTLKACWNQMIKFIHISRALFAKGKM